MNRGAFGPDILTNPEPAIFRVLDGLDEKFANLVSGCLWVAVLARDNLRQLGLVPVIHGILRLLIFFSVAPVIGV